MFHSAHGSATRRLLKGRTSAGEFNITQNDLTTIWSNQNGKCYYSEIQMVPQPSSDWMCSIERLDNNKGYIIGNVVLVCFELNTPAGWNLDKIVRMLFSLHEYIDDNLLIQMINNDLNRPIAKQNREPLIINSLGQYKCRKCNVFKFKTDFNQNIGKGCKNCLSIYNKQIHATVRGHLKLLLSHAKNRVKNNCIGSDKSRFNEFDITYEYLTDLLRYQRGRCAYSGIKLNYGNSRENDWIASLERINPTRGYLKSNVCLICSEFNGTDHTASETYSNGGSGAWSREKFNFFLSNVMYKIGPNPTMNISGVFFTLEMWKLINNSLCIKGPPTSCQIEIINTV
jgi:hypothetical protein